MYFVDFLEINCSLKYNTGPPILIEIMLIIENYFAVTLTPVTTNRCISPEMKHIHNN